MQQDTVTAYIAIILFLGALVVAFVFCYGYGYHKGKSDTATTLIPSHQQDLEQVMIINENQIQDEIKNCKTTITEAMQQQDRFWEIINMNIPVSMREYNQKK